MPEEEDIGNKHKKFSKDCTCGSGDILADRQTHKQTQTDILITIPRNRFRGQSNKRTILFGTWIGRAIMWLF